MERRGKEHIVIMMKGEALRVLTGVCSCHFPLAKAKLRPDVYGK